MTPTGCLTCQYGNKEDPGSKELVSVLGGTEQTYQLAWDLVREYSSSGAGGKMLRMTDLGRNLPPRIGARNGNFQDFHD